MGPILAAMALSIGGLGPPPLLPTAPDAPDPPSPAGMAFKSGARLGFRRASLRRASSCFFFATSGLGIFLGRHPQWGHPRFAALAAFVLLLNFPCLGHLASIVWPCPPLWGKDTVG